MTLLLSIHSLSKAFGSQLLFKNISFAISQNDRIGLFGPNGCGKSTLIKILMNLEDADEGYVSRKQELRIGYASQEPQFPSKPVEEVLVEHCSFRDPEEALLQARILLSKALFENPKQNASELSGGWKKRLDILRALMQQPDLLLLDEPTNHLDLEGILWLEKFLLREKVAFLTVSHDRYFLNNVCNKIIELNRCYPEGIFMIDGGMERFLEHKEVFLKGQQQQERGLASIVRNELEWLRRSPQARTTKSRSRIQKAHELMGELSELKERNKQKKVNIEFSASDRETRKLLVAKNLKKSVGEKDSQRVLFKGLDLVLSPGSRLGIVGKNGTGKTTLLKILSGAITADMGTLKYADGLKLVYFDQHREHLPPNISLKRALSPMSDTVNYRGQQIHVNGWAEKFLFAKNRLELPVGALSGGERARILLARLMLEPADLLFLDEPTNDLDIATLEVIEENLMQFNGAVVLISHDRCLMDKVCTEIVCLGLEEQAHFFADYSQLEKAFSAPPAKKADTINEKTSIITLPKGVKLSYKEQKELDNMESSVFALEAEIDRIKRLLEESATHADPQCAHEQYKLLAEKEAQQEKLFARWQQLIDIKEKM